MLRNRLFLFFVPLLLVGGLSLAGCASDSNGASGSGSQAQDQAKSASVEVVDAQAFQAATQKPGVVIVDVRTPEEFAEGHIENAVNIDINGGSFSEEISQLDPTKDYAVYCRSGNRSATAVAEMVDAGFTSIVELDNGILAWQAADYPVVTG